MRQMKSEAFSRGDILFDLGRLAEEMCFVARGNIYILSGEDTESPIVTLGKGTLIGQINLLYSKVTKFKVSKMLIIRAGEIPSRPRGGRSI